MNRFFAGLGAFIAFAAILVGVPIALAVIAGNPLPTSGEWHNIVTLTPDYGNVILLTKVLPLIGWLAWLAFAIPFLIELVAAAAGRTTRKRSWAFRGQQQLATMLIAAIAMMFAGGIGLAGASPAHAETAHTAVAATAPATPASHQETRTVTEIQNTRVTVEKGDTLWGIAQRDLGNGADYGKIFDASTGTVQAGGQHLTDPNLILPGWDLNVPKTVTVEEPATPPPAPSNTPQQGSSSGTQASPSPAQTPSQTKQETGPGAAQNQDAPGQVQTGTPTTDHSTKAEVTTSSQDAVDLSVPLTTGGGVASILAAGLLTALGVRRLRQRRRRKTGERIAMPDGAAATEELELRMVEDSLGVQEVDNALRALQAWALLTETRLPEIFALRLEESREVALYLTEPADLPEPFEPASEDHTAWIVRPGRGKPPTYPVGSPYPALTTIGTDAHSGVLMLDLEQIGSLTITGDTGLALGVLNALATELAVNPWSEQIQVSLVGMPDHLASEANAYRIHPVDDVELLIRNIRADLEHRQASFASYGVSDVYEARTRAADSESWAPHVIILGQTPSEALRQELADLVAEVPRLGVATVGRSAEAGVGSTVRITSRDHAELISALPGTPALPFRPQILDGQELGNIQRMFTVTHEEAHLAPAPEVPDLVAEVAPTPAPAPTAADVADADRVEAGEGPLDVEETPAPNHTATVPDAQNAEVGPAAAAAAHILAEPGPVAISTVEGREQLPYLRILGPVEADNLPQTGKIPGRGLELLAYLTLHGPVPGRQLQEDFWRGKPRERAINNQKGLVGPTRDFLGNAPDGTKWLPENVRGEGFRTHGALRTDWDDFRDLIGTDLASTPNDSLVAAVRLVRGVPFQAVNTTRGWWQWIGLDEQDMIAAILDASDELGRRALAAGDTEQAIYAGRVAQTVDPLNGQGWRTEMRAAWKRRDIEEFLNIVERNIATLEAADPDDDLDEETQDLVAAARADLGA